MRLPALLGLIALALPAPAFACKAAYNFRVESWETDVPDCLKMEAFGGYENAFLEIENTCDDAATIEATSCAGCTSETLEIAAGEGPLEFIVETRQMEQETVRHELAWSLPDQSGTAQVEIYYQDNSDACRDFACDVALAGGATGPGGALALLFGLFVGLRRRH